MSRKYRGRTLDVTAFPDETGDLLKTLVNTHGVPFRQSDGRHVFLYSGQRGERVMKVSAMSSPISVRKRLTQWAEENGRSL